MISAQKSYIDIHVHLGAIGSNTKSFVKESLRNRFGLFLLKKKYGIEEKEDKELLNEKFQAYLIEIIENSLYLKKAVILSIDGIYDDNGELDREKTQLYICNDDLYSFCRKSEALIPGPGINPCRKDWETELDKANENKAKLIKFLPNSQNFNPSDKRFLPFYRTMKKYGMALLSHTGYEHAIKATNQSLGNPGLLKVPLDEGLTVIAAHSGTSGIFHVREYFRDFLKLTKSYPNLYGDLSGMTNISRFTYFKKLLNESILKDRLVHGSDFPIYPMAQLFLKNDYDHTMLEKVKELKDNPLDIDIFIKKSIGVPEEAFLRGFELLNL